MVNHTFEDCAISAKGSELHLVVDVCTCMDKTSLVNQNWQYRKEVSSRKAIYVCLWRTRTVPFVKKPIIV